MANRISSKQVDAIVNQITAIAKEATKEIAEEVTVRLEIGYEKCIEEFYKDYRNPRYYDRTYSTFYASTGFGDMAIWKRCVKKNNRGYISGIIVDSSNITEEPYRAETEWVFERTFNEGIHGMTPEEVSDADWLKPNGLTPFYRYPLFYGGRLWHKKPMSPTPKERMDKKYREMFKQLDDITKEKMNEAFGRRK